MLHVNMLGERWGLPRTHGARPMHLNMFYISALVSRISLLKLHKFETFQDAPRIHEKKEIL